MNPYKRRAATLRKNYVWSTGYSLLDTTHCPEYLLEEFLRVLNSCTALTCIKFMCKHELILDLKTAALLGISIGELFKNPLYDFVKPLSIFCPEEEIDESYFGV